MTEGTMETLSQALRTAAKTHEESKTQQIAGKTQIVSIADAATLAADFYGDLNMAPVIALLLDRAWTQSLEWASNYPE